MPHLSVHTAACLYISRGFGRRPSGKMNHLTALPRSFSPAMGHRRDRKGSAVSGWSKCKGALSMGQFDLRCLDHKFIAGVNISQNQPVMFATSQGPQDDPHKWRWLCLEGDTDPSLVKPLRSNGGSPEPGDPSCCWDGELVGRLAGWLVSRQQPIIL